MKYVISYDNGTGWKEWASEPQPTVVEAWAVAGLSPDSHGVGDWYELLEVEEDEKEEE